MNSQNDQIMIMIQEQKTVNGDTRKTRVTCSYTKLANHFRGNEQWLELNSIVAIRPSDKANKAYKESRLES